MLSKERIKEAENNLRTYLAQRLLTKTKEIDTRARSVLIQNSKESLKIAEHLFDQNLSDLWTIVISYYSMFYISNAVLCELGYKIGDKIVHKVTSDALICLVRNRLGTSILEGYEETKAEALGIARIQADELLTSFEYELKKRREIQYTTTSGTKRSKAETSLSRAKNFLAELEKLLPPLQPS